MIETSRILIAVINLDWPSVPSSRDKKVGYGQALGFPPYYRHIPLLRVIDSRPWYSSLVSYPPLLLPTPLTEGIILCPMGWPTLVGSLPWLYEGS